MVLVEDVSDQEIDEGQVTDLEIHLMSEQSLSLLLVFEMGLHQHNSTMLNGPEWLLEPCWEPQQKQQSVELRW